ncbi:MAG: hypothetical protein GTO45_28150, partial [Candidatus Aminicenantes bacterium]|nr:hypothetical protein [Candidatus Aminicenantes bacterium]NIM82673.1 hypothetical protein [Candidatus Aminicenantes bacterium]NIN22046.1 hypothetical protein [Candidatus Aminicenantes bacterium]NIN45803.1 hypothetical protein [Candidatus Aminicenantes bacterium]NIN88641.1 hypothetical protein [Candidatus Aminicenantes bacterium]
EARTAGEMYAAALRKELGTIHLLGSPDLDSPAVKMEDAFVSLCISETLRSDECFDSGKKQ